ncbi:hypothetical protein ABBQ32_013046 [Trebouxia sp. C0010 RCD-2024]
MDDLDEDAPPALANLASQVAALTSKPGVSSLGVTPAAVTPKYIASSQPKPLKAGFFDAPKDQKRPQKHKEGNAATLPHVKAKQPPAVPSSFVIPPNEQERQYAAMRQKLADDLMPTEDSIRQISGNKTLLAGFDDPEVMRAVNDVAQNPADIRKYMSNKKVQAFYQQMGSVMASRCDELGASQAKPRSSKPSSSTASSSFLSKPAFNKQSQKQQSCRIEEVS